MKLSGERFNSEGWRTPELAEESMIDLARDVVVALYNGDAESWAKWVGENRVGIATQITPPVPAAPVVVKDEQHLVRYWDEAWDVLLMVRSGDVDHACLVTFHDPFVSPWLLCEPVFVP